MSDPSTFNRRFADTAGLARRFGDSDAQADAVALLRRMTDIAISLSLEKDPELLLEKILLEAKSIANADGGTLYYLTEDDYLDFAIVRTDSLNAAYGGSASKHPPLDPIAVYNEDGDPNYSVQAVFAVLKQKTINIDDVYDADGFDFEGTKKFDKQFGYRTKSVITVPMVNHKDESIACLQLINSMDPKTGEVVPFSNEVQQVVEALASLAAVTVDNKHLIEAQANLLDSFIQVLAKAIDAKSPYTGGHCERVPVLTKMLAKAGCESNEGIFKDFDLNDDEWHELHVAAWLHDCGKVSTPVHIMDKATKLETINDRIDTLRARWEVLKRDAEIEYYKALAEGKGNAAELKKIFDTRIKELDNEMDFLNTANIGGEFMKDEDIERLQSIAKGTFQYKGEDTPLLSEEEVYNLSIRRGTINAEERKVMEDHMVHTMHMLEALPFPKHLKRVPEYALGHHERMDGKGYPKGVLAGEMSIPARMMAVADVFEALTASDRPYKPAKKLSESMKIIGFMKKENHLDPEMVDLFVKSKTYIAYAKQYLTDELMDEVDEEWILGITPNEMN